MTHEELTRMAGNLGEQGGSASTHRSRDQDKGKGAMEQDQNNEGGNTSMKGQLGHRDEDTELKDADSDLPG
jgi:hypothetical protein